jgi:formamidopyrimidine-DNA glycosylase
MTGRWVKRSIDDPKERWERARLDLEKPGKKGARVYSVRYIDPRMFGRFVVAREDVAGWTALGPDPLNDEIDPEALHARIAKSKRTIKEVLMDQTVIAGVGNIQATDALFLARVLPERIGTEIELRETRAILRAIHKSIERTLAKEKGPEITYVEDPGAPNPFIVYGRAGEPCPRCKTTLVRTVLGGRATVHCPHCQH